MVKQRKQYNNAVVEATQSSQNDQSADFFGSLVEILGQALVCGFVVFALNSFVFLLTIIPTSSMYPTVGYPSLNIANRLAYVFDEPKRGDIVYFRRDNGDDMVLVKRIIAVGGDVIEGKDGKVYLNGELLEEDYLNEAPEVFDFGPYEVLEGSYFMMGDNRNHSYDSRCWGEHFVPRENIIAKQGLMFDLAPYTPKNLLSNSNTKN